VNCGNLSGRELKGGTGKNYVRIDGVVQVAEVPGRIVAIQATEEALFVVFEQPRRWWQFWLGDYGVLRFEGERTA
jgi:hypothetical protein